MQAGLRKHAVKAHASSYHWLACASLYSGTEYKGTNHGRLGLCGVTLRCSMHVLRVLWSPTKQLEPQLRRLGERHAVEWQLGTVRRTDHSQDLTCKL